jgi:hydrogenase maturation protein HypF
LGLLFEILGSQSAEHAAAWFNASEIGTLTSMLTSPVNSPRTSSMGRLFDAVAAICGLSPVISFEGQAAMALEFAADEHEQSAYALTIGKHCTPHAPREVADQSRAPLIANAAPVIRPAAPICVNAADAGREEYIADWEPMIRSVLADRAAGVPLSRISGRFHNALADMAVTIATTLGRQLNCRPSEPTELPTRGGSTTAAPTELPVVLTGGCFQNALLQARVRSRLAAAGFQVYTHHQVPPGDGGIALGQVFLALQSMQGSTNVSGNSG